MQALLRTSCFAFFALSQSVNAEGLDHVLAHPPFAGAYVCTEHFQGQLPYPGDDLGTDCLVTEIVAEGGREWPRTHRGDGSRNEDWFSWNAPLLSPCECEVLKIHVNDVTNEPGRLGKPPASIIVLKREDGVHFMLAHVQDIKVEVGARVGYGDEVARIGNNGYGRTPHVHIGAWRERTPLQIRWDQRYMNGANKPGS